MINVKINSVTVEATCDDCGYEHVVQNEPKDSLTSFSIECGCGNSILVDLKRELFGVRSCYDVLIEDTGITAEELWEVQEKLRRLGRVNLLYELNPEDAMFLFYKNARDFVYWYFIDDCEDDVINDIILRMLEQRVDESQVGKTLWEIEFENDPFVHVLSSGKVLWIVA